MIMYVYSLNHFGALEVALETLVHNTTCVANKLIRWAVVMKTRGSCIEYLCRH